MLKKNYDIYIFVKKKYIGQNLMDLSNKLLSW